MKKKTIITIGWWNGHSNILAWIYEEIINEREVFSIVSMSDDGRTTGKLMRLFEEQFDMHLPPPWDLRRCLFALSGSKYRTIFSLVLEHTFVEDINIKDISLWDLFRKAFIEVNESGGFKDKKEKERVEKFLIGEGKLVEKLKHGLQGNIDIILPLDTSIKWHKFWNLFMASLFFAYKDYEKMLLVMHEILEVNGKVLPVTLDKATIEAVLENGEVIVTQDAISNIAEYTSSIFELRLAKGSENAHHIKTMDEVFSFADDIIIAPGDLYTSTISNLIIGGIKKLISKSKGKIIYIANNTNKGGETNGYRVIDFVNEIEKYIGRKIDILIVNNHKPHLSTLELNFLKENISVKGGEYIYLSETEKKQLNERGIVLIEDDFIDRTSLYKHDAKAIAKTIKKRL